MIELTGKFNTAKVFTDNIEETAVGQVIAMLNQEFMKDSRVRIMPDVHAGAGCTIGTTMTLHGRVVPNMVGVDIGCALLTTKLTRRDGFNLENLDAIIHSEVPAGRDVHKVPRIMAKVVMRDLVNKLRCVEHVNLERAELSVGTLGGGNHFIEMDIERGGDGSTMYLVIHSGSRYLGKQIAEYYQSEAVKARSSTDIAKTIADLKAAGRSKDIAAEIKKLTAGMSRADKELAYLEGQLYTDYLHDMAIAQEYAMWNRRVIKDSILGWLHNVIPVWSFETVHNYIDLSSSEPILRKGAISAKKGERVLIPMNMRDGSLICYGKGNPDWNWSAPHGAGRIMSRRVARDTIKMEDYEEAMKGIMSTTVNRSTLDEAPFAYKPMDEIIANIGDTVEIERVITPIYNFKAAE